MNVFVHTIAEYNPGHGPVGCNIGVVYFSKDLEEKDEDTDVDTWFQKQFEAFQLTKPDSDCQFIEWLKETHEEDIDDGRDGYAPLESHHHVFVSEY